MKLINILSDYKYKIFNQHWWRNFYYTQISSRLRPRNKWLTKKIPRTWADKDTLWEICIIEGIKDYVEGEHALDYYQKSQVDPSYPDHQKEFDKEVLRAYEIVAITIPYLEKKLDIAWNNIPHRDFNNINLVTPKNYDETYGEVNKLEKQIKDLKTEVMIWAVNKRESIWT